MKKTKRFLIELLFSIMVAANLSAFSKENIISPIEGVWSNPQPLVIDVPENNEIYYSFTSDNPLESGLIYDSPLAIEQTGEINLCIVAIDIEGKKTKINIQYTVNSIKPFIGDIENGAVFTEINKGSILTLPAGKKVTIPQGFKYCLGKNKKPAIENEDIFVSESNLLEKYVPCTLTDGKNMWRFVIHSVSSREEGEWEQITPFKISDWNEITYTGGNFIYQIDDEYWNASKKTVFIDRNVSHVIKWQSVAYEFGNPVYFMVVPPKPKLTSQTLQNGSVVFSIPEDSKFQLKAINKSSVNGTIPEEIYNFITVDVFKGDEAKGDIEFCVYYDGVYQGNLSSSFLIDKQAPEPPEFCSSTKLSFVHEKVKLNIEEQKDSVIFYAISKPLSSPNSFENSSRETFDSVPEGEYKKYDGRTFILSSTENNATFHKIKAYAVDSYGNKSAVSEFRVVIDEANFYLSAKGKNLKIISETQTEEPDGSYSNPFTTMSQAVETINKNSYTRLHIIGDFNVTDEVLNITSNCTFLGNKSHIILDSFSAIKISGAAFEAKNCYFEKKVTNAQENSFVNEDKSNVLRKMFIMNNSTVSFEDCDLIAIFGQEGIACSTVNSKLNFKNISITSQAENYTCCIASNNSSVEVTNCDLTSVAETCVNINANGGVISLTNNSCSVIGHLSRVAELTKTGAEIKNNTFTIKNNSELKSEAIWKDADTILVNTGNKTND